VIGRGRGDRILRFEVRGGISNEAPACPLYPRLQDSGATSVHLRLPPGSPCRARVEWRGPWGPHFNEAWPTMLECANRDAAAYRASSDFMWAVIMRVQARTGSARLNNDGSRSALVRPSTLQRRARRECSASSSTKTGRWKKPRPTRPAWRDANPVLLGTAGIPLKPPEGADQFIEIAHGSGIWWFDTSCRLRGLAAVVERSVGDDESRCRRVIAPVRRDVTSRKARTPVARRP
jgi:hypothetical protein